MIICTREQLKPYTNKRTIKNTNIMATIIAKLDNFSPLWTAKELETLLNNGSSRDAVTWLQNNCPYDQSITNEEKEMIETLCDGVIFDFAGYKLLYSDLGYIEKIELLKY